MKDSRIIVYTILIIAVVIGAIWLGTGVATEQMATLIKVGVGALLIVCILLGQRIWLLYLFLVAMEVRVIRGLSTAEFGQMILIGFSLILFLMRRLKLKITYSELDTWRIIIALLIIQVYVRFPVGLNLLGADSVGARPYVLAALAFVAGLLLSKYRVPASDIRWTVKATILGTICAFPVNRLLGGFRGGGVASSSVAVVEGGISTEEAGRVSTFGNFGEVLNRFLISRISPLKACFRPLWAIVLLLILVFAAISGYRSYVASAGLLLLAGIAYRGGTFSLFASFALGALALATLAYINIVAPLPPNVQRALSPFPGTWEEKYAGQAERSTEWRVEMWEAALFTDEWIGNKVLGDGLGFTKDELKRMQALEQSGEAQGIGGLTAQQETMMIQGNYHSGPVQTIRTVGYVGLIVLMAAIIRLAVHAHREIMRCKGTEWYPYMLFFGIPMVIYPLFFTFIFGTFEEGVTVFFLQSGLLELLRNNIPIPPYEKKKQKAYIPMTHNKINTMKSAG